MRIDELIALQRRHHGPARLQRSLGDGFLYAKNPVFRRIRRATLDAGFRFTLDDPGSYFAFPLISLPTLLAKRRIPLSRQRSTARRARTSAPALLSLGGSREEPPDAELPPARIRARRLVREAFRKSARRRTRARASGWLVHVMLSESFAMTAEYLAACAVGDPVHSWLFSISSYRHRTQKKKAIGELIDEIGVEAVGWAIFGAFLYSNFLVDRLGRAELERILAFSPITSKLRLAPSRREKLRVAIQALSQMSPEFRIDTSRIFLTMLGHSRDIRRLLSRDPFDLAERDPTLADRTATLVRILTDDEPRYRRAR